MKRNFKFRIAFFDYKCFNVYGKHFKRTLLHSYDGRLFDALY